MRILIGILFALFLGLTGLLLWSGLTKGHNWGDDFAAYIMQAEGIVQGKTSQFLDANRFTIEKSTRTVGPVAYPWGFPLLLAPVYAVYGLNLIALKSVAVICYLLFLCTLWFGFRQYHSAFWLIVLTCLFAINPTMLEFMNNIVSDIPFLLFSTLSVLLIGIVVIPGRCLISPVCDRLLLGSAMATAFLLRINGILLLVTLGIAQSIVTLQSRQARATHSSINLTSFSQRKRASVRAVTFLTLPYVTFVILVVAFGTLLPKGGSTYFSYLLGTLSLKTIKHNLFYYIRLPRDFFALRRRPYGDIVYLGTIPLAIVGMMRRYRSDCHIILYMMMTILLYILWPDTNGLRFLFPVLPFYFSFCIAGLQGVGVTTGAKRTRWKAIRSLPVLFLLLWFGMRSTNYALDNLSRSREVASGAFVETSRNMFKFIRENTEAEATVIFFKPRLMRLMTGRRSLMLDEVEALSRDDYLCFYLRDDRYDQVSDRDVEILKEKGSIELIYTNPDFQVYRLSVADE